MPLEAFLEIIADVASITELPRCRKGHNGNDWVYPSDEEAFKPREVGQGLVALAEMLKVLIRIHLLVIGVVASGTHFWILRRSLPTSTFDRFAVVTLLPRRGDTTMGPFAREDRPLFITIMAVVKLQGTQVREGVAQMGAHNGIVELP